MTAEIKLNSAETRSLDEVVNSFLLEQKVTARDVDIVLVSRQSGGSYTINVADKK